MKLKLLYLGIALFMGISGYSIFHAFTPEPIPHKTIETIETIEPVIEPLKSEPLPSVKQPTPKAVISTPAPKVEKEETIGDSGLTAKELEQKIKEWDDVDDYVPVPSYTPPKIDPMPEFDDYDVGETPKLKKLDLPKPHYETVCWQDTLLGKQCKTTMTIK